MCILMVAQQRGNADERYTHSTAIVEQNNNANNNGEKKQIPSEQHIRSTDAHNEN